MDKTQLIVLIIGCVVAALGVLFVVIGWFSKKKLSAIQETSTADAGMASQMADTAGSNKVEIKGVAGHEQPLVSPASGTQCVYYRHQVEQLHVTYDRDSQGRSYRREEWRTVADSERHLPFTVSDASGSVTVKPEDAKFVVEKVIDRQFGAPGYEGPQAERSAVGEVIGTVIDSLDGRYEGGYRTSEWVVPVGQELYVLGNVFRTEKGAEVRKGEGPFIISSKSEEELTKKYKISFGLWLGFGILLGVGGIGLAIYAAAFLGK